MTTPARYHLEEAERAIGRSQRSHNDRMRSGAEGGTGKKEVEELRFALRRTVFAVELIAQELGERLATEPSTTYKEAWPRAAEDPDMTDTSATAAPGEAIFDIADRYEVRPDFLMYVVYEIPTGLPITWPVHEEEAQEICDAHNEEWREYVMAGGSVDD